MKLTDLEKNKGSKISNQMKSTSTPGRFGAATADTPDRREQRKRDQALGLMPFAVKLDGDLVKQIQTLAQQRQTGLNELVAELLKIGLAR